MLLQLADIKLQFVYMIIFQNTNEAVCPVLGVIGNKSDLNEKRQVTRTAGEQLAKRVGATFGEVSAKTGDGIDEVRSACMFTKIIFI